jgi:hypothetical protein
MAKRTETVDLENALIKYTREKRIYGCEEITIGFYNNGYGNEIVDFMTMDSKGIIRCYEIKVTLQDLKSDAKKSWYGHYNYLVVSKELYDTVENWREHVPEYIGIIVGNRLHVVYKPKKQIISIETGIMLKESLVRSMYWKIDKYKNANNLENHKKLKSEIRRLKKERDYQQSGAKNAEKIIREYERCKSFNEGIEINLEQMAKEELSKFLTRKGLGQYNEK